MEKVISTGTIKFYNQMRGYGFVIDEATKKEYFFHATGLLNKWIDKGSVVTFELCQDKRGIKAINVK